MQNQYPEAMVTISLKEYNDLLSDKEKLKDNDVQRIKDKVSESIKGIIEKQVSGVYSYTNPIALFMDSFRKNGLNVIIISNPGSSRLSSLKIEELSPIPEFTNDRVN